MRLESSILLLVEHGGREEEQGKLSRLTENQQDHMICLGHARITWQFF